MQSVIIRGGLLAAVAAVLVLGYGFAPEVKAQQAAVTPLALTAKGNWSASANYVTDDIVTSRGSAWRAKRASNNKVPGSTSPSTAADWEWFAAGFNPLGAWSNAKTYQPNDLVIYLGATWRARITSLNKTPKSDANWQQFAAKGATGATGPTGATGAIGATGPAGPNTDIPAGTVSAPSFSFNGDPGTGIYSPTTGKIALVENGVQVLHTRGGNAALGWSALSAANPGQANTAVGSGALNNNTSSYNTAVGNNALSSNTGLRNTAVGESALATNTAGQFNTALGGSAMYGNTQGNYNVAVGNEAASGNTTGGFNVAIGIQALQFNNGSNNIAIGYAAAYLAGFNAAPSINNSIYIGYSGSPTFSDTIKIGSSQTKTLVAGIAGVTTELNDAVPVMVASDGQLGVTSSSRRYKTDIETMADVSAMLVKLRPVTFHYKQAQDNGAHPLQYGLIAEEVADVFPDLAVFKSGQPETVKYHLLPSFLLAGYQAQQKTIAAQVSRIDALEERLRKLEALLPQTKAASLQ